jgi:hypothetical protein
MLLMATLLASIIIFLPVVLNQFILKSYQSEESGEPLRIRKSLGLLVYFGCLGFAFLFVEIPLIQRFILFLGHPSFALATVLFTILFFSGLGSQFNHRIRLETALGILVLLLLAWNLLLPALISRVLGLSMEARLLTTVVTLAPIGFFMGIPFPSGIRLVVRLDSQPQLVPWIWAINGATSVIASILAALLALSLGFNWVFRLGALSYIGAWLSIKALERLHRS